MQFLHAYELMKKDIYGLEVSTSRPYEEHINNISDLQTCQYFVFELIRVND